MVISASSFNVGFTTRSSQTYLRVNTEVSYIKAPGKLLAIGCAKCFGEYGQIFFYDAQNLNLTYTLEGDRNNKNVGRKVVYRENTGYSEQFLYTSHKSNKIILNSIVFFKKTGNDYWEQKRDEGLLELTVTSIEEHLTFDNYHDDFIYKLQSGTDLRTFLSCPYNYIYNTEDEDSNDGGPLLGNRNCTRCLNRVPFSYGFNKEECVTCTSLVGFVANADEYIQYFYNEACGDFQACDATNSCNSGGSTTTTEEEDDIFVWGDNYGYDGTIVKAPEPDQGSSSTILILILIFLALAVIIVCYIFFKRH